MAPNPKQPRQPRKHSSGSGPRRGRPRKDREEEQEKRVDMTLPPSLLDTTIADGEEYRPSVAAPRAEERAPVPDNVGNEAPPPPPPPPA